jgi:hypothetical protein
MSKPWKVTAATLLAAALWGPASAGAAPAADAPSAATPSAEPGIWQEHKYSFAFFGFTTTYSCDGLADKLRLLLLAAGARADAKATPGACAAGFGRPDKFARADLLFYTLAPDAAAVAAQGTAPGAAPAGAPQSAAAGSWRQVVLAAHSPRDLATGDCELVEQFATKVLPLFATREIDNHTVCVPHQESGSRIDLKFDAFARARGLSAT